jgi:hypothetical protein
MRNKRLIRKKKHNYITPLIQKPTRHYREKQKFTEETAAQAIVKEGRTISGRFIRL